MKQTKWDYQLCDDGGVSTEEDVKVFLSVGTTFVHEYGTYKVTDHRIMKDGTIEIWCDRQ